MPRRKSKPKVDYKSRYRRWVQKYTGRKTVSSDGLTMAVISTAEKRLGLQLPSSMRDYYRTCGGAEDLNDAHNHVLPPSRLQKKDGFLIFATENQNVVHWGVKLTDLSEADPEVWQQAGESGSEWYSEDASFSNFLEKMFDWQTASNA
jgi:cell wall assembly regulator SMI1